MLRERCSSTIGLVNTIGCALFFMRATLGFRSCECLHATIIISLFYNGTFSVITYGCRQIFKPCNFSVSILLLSSLILRK